MKVIKMKHLFLLSISILLWFPGYSVSLKKINVEDYSVIAGGEDATPGVLRALEVCKSLHNTVLVFPKGEYHFYPDYGVDRYCFISNNDEGLKRVVFPLIDFENLIIEGNGSLFIFHGFVNAFIVENSENITFQNFSIDYNRPFHSEANILANNTDGIDVEIPENFPFRISKGLLLFTDGKLEDRRKTTVNKPTVYSYGSLLEFDAEKRETAFMARDFYLDGSPLPAKSIGGRKVRIFLDGLKGTVGNIMTFGPSNRNYPGFTLTDSRDIKFHQITIHHSGGMGIIGQRTHNILVDSCKVTPSAGRVISCTADATHFVNCTGKIELSHCLFENQKDDATNIHGIYVQIAKILSPNEIIVQLKHRQQFGFDFLKEDAKVEFVKGRNLVTEGEAYVISSNRLNKEFTQVSFSNPLPLGIEVGDAIAEIRDYPEIHIRNNIIRRNRARGMLLNCRGKTIVEDNYFHSPGAAILFEGDASFWYEQGGVTDCVIRNNIFNNCLYGVWGKAVIDVAAGIHEDEELSRYNKNIKIYGNTFYIFDDMLLLNLYGVDDLYWYDNKVERTHAYPRTRKRDYLFHVEYSDNVQIDSYIQN